MQSRHKNVKSENSHYGSRDVTLAALMKVHYLPYLEHSNIPAIGEGEDQIAKSGYQKAQFMYRYNLKEPLLGPGARFDHIYQHKRLEAYDFNKHRTFIMGNSFAYGFGVDAKDKYYMHLDLELQNERNMHIIPASVSAINSNQISILFHSTVLPLKPDVVVFIDGWNDVMMPMLFCVRPGDPMIMSALYQKYHHVFFNLIIELCKRSKWFSRFITRKIEHDRNELFKLVESDKSFRSHLHQSIVNIYMTNAEIMIEGCLNRNIKVAHMLQPCGDVLWEKYRNNFTQEQRLGYQQRMMNYPWGGLKLGPHLNELFEIIESEIKKRSWSKHSHHITDQLSLDHFFDPGHLNIEGHSAFKSILKKIITQTIGAADEQSRIQDIHSRRVG